MARLLWVAAFLWASSSFGYGGGGNVGGAPTGGGVGCQAPPDPAVYIPVRGAGGAATDVGSTEGIVGAAKSAEVVCRDLKDNEAKDCHDDMDSLRGNNATMSSTSSVNEIAAQGRQEVADFQGKLNEQFGKCKDNYEVNEKLCSAARKGARQALEKYRNALKDPKYCDLMNKVSQAQKKLEQAEQSAAQAQQGLAGAQGKYDSTTASNDSVDSQLQQQAYNSTGSGEDAAAQAEEIARDQPDQYAAGIEYTRNGVREVYPIIPGSSASTIQNNWGYISSKPGVIMISPRPK